MIQTPPSNSGPARPGGSSLDPIGPDAGGTARRETGADDAQRFSDMMRGDGQGTRTGAEADRRRGGGDTAGHGQPGDQGQGQDADAPLPGPFDLLRPGGMAGGRLAGADAGASSRTADLQQVVQAVAERVLVSDGSDGRQEVRIQLKESVLPGVEVRIRQEGGRTVVDFVSQNADSTRFLDGQRGALGSLLEGRLKTDVEVRVTASDGTDTGGDTGDGRSREHYVAEPADEHTDEAGESGS